MKRLLYALFFGATTTLFIVACYWFGRSVVPNVMGLEEPNIHSLELGLYLLIGAVLGSSTIGLSVRIKEPTAMMVRVALYCAYGAAVASGFGGGCMLEEACNTRVAEHVTAMTFQAQAMDTLAGGCVAEFFALIFRRSWLLRSIK